MTEQIYTVIPLCVDVWTKILAEHLYEYSDVIKCVCKGLQHIVVTRCGGFPTLTPSDMIRRNHLELFRWATDGNICALSSHMVRSVMITSSCVGNLKIVKECYDRVRSRKDVNIHFALEASLIEAAENGQCEIIKWCRDNGAIAINMGLRSAAQRGQYESALLCCEHGALVTTELIQPAIDGGNTRILQLMFERGADDVSYALRYSSSRGAIDMMITSKKHGARNFNESLILASEHGHIDAALLCISWGATNVETAKSIALDKGNLELYKSLLNVTK